jgi:COP9 signalosome complex subunit 6
VLQCVNGVAIILISPSLSLSAISAPDFAWPQFIPFNESPLYLILDTLVSKVTKGLPVQVFESELRIINDEPTLLFSKVQYRIETGEAERIAVDHVARVSASGTAEGSQRTLLNLAHTTQDTSHNTAASQPASKADSTSSAVTTHLLGMHNAIKMLNGKIKNLTSYLHAVEKGKHIIVMAPLRLWSE